MTSKLIAWISPAIDGYFEQRREKLDYLSPVSASVNCRPLNGAASHVIDKTWIAIVNCISFYN
jgi:hypothetical protein